jgi:hypothetical protein
MAGEVACLWRLGTEPLAEEDAIIVPGVMDPMADIVADCGDDECWWKDPEEEDRSVKPSIDFLSCLPDAPLICW